MFVRFSEMEAIKQTPHHRLVRKKEERLADSPVTVPSMATLF
jgi:hypothetical protein